MSVLMPTVLRSQLESGFNEFIVYWLSRLNHKVIRTSMQSNHCTSPGADLLLLNYYSQLIYCKITFAACASRNKNEKQAGGF